MHWFVCARSNIEKVGPHTTFVHMAYKFPIGLKNRDFVVLSEKRAAARCCSGRASIFFDLFFCTCTINHY